MISFVKREKWRSLLNGPSRLIETEGKHTMSSSAYYMLVVISPPLPLIHDQGCLDIPFIPVHQFQAVNADGAGFPEVLPELFH